MEIGEEEVRRWRRDESSTATNTLCFIELYSAPTEQLFSIQSRFDVPSSSFYCWHNCMLGIELEHTRYQYVQQCAFTPTHSLKGPSYFDLRSAKFRTQITIKYLHSIVPRINKLLSLLSTKSGIPSFTTYFGMNIYYYSEWHTLHVARHLFAKYTFLMDITK